MDEVVSKAVKNYFHLYSGDDYSLKRLDEGMSGAEVYYLQIKRSRRPREVGPYILKVIDTSSQWYGVDGDEAEKSQRIYDGCPSFQEHLVKLCHQSRSDGKLVLISSYALHTVLRSISLRQNGLDEKCRKLSDISFDLLAKFNDGSIEFRHGSVVKELCRYRLDEGGNFQKRIARLLKHPEAPGMNIKGKVLPNPLHCLEPVCSAVEERDYQFLWGNVHGDLHQKNILTLDQDGKGKAPGYVVIDYDSFNENFLLFDHAYLELNLFDTELEGKDFMAWMEAMEQILSLEPEEEYSGSLDFYGPGRLHDGVMAGIVEWFRTNMPENMDACRVQYVLARIAAGINFFSKGKITDENQLIRYLIYIAINIRVLLSYLGMDWDKEETTRLRQRQGHEGLPDRIWESCNGFNSRYLKILVTDDDYAAEDYEAVKGVGALKWDIILDAGRSMSGEDLYAVLGPLIKQHRNLSFKKGAVEAGEKIPVKGNCIWLDGKKPPEESDIRHRIRMKRLIEPILKYMSGMQSLKSLLFLFDCQRGGILVDGMMELLLDLNILKKGSVVLCLGSGMDQMYCDHLAKEGVGCCQLLDGSLADVAQMVRNYGLERLPTDNQVRLPGIGNKWVEITESEHEYYSSSVELVYSGLEDKVEDYSGGKDFYKGNEVSWLDLEQGKDIRLSGYEKHKQLLLSSLEKAKTPILRLGHGPGGGGTTMSRRLMWDIKDRYPTVRMRAYTGDTINIICEIYRKTVNPVLVVMEMGSTVISEDELNTLVNGVNAQSCRALFLRVERSALDEHGKGIDIKVEGELTYDDAKAFLGRYSGFTDDQRRLDQLNNLTHNRYDSEWEGQCCPFFYGFYTFQEEYQALLPFIEMTVKSCSEEVREILTDLSLITKYSQVICIPYDEMLSRLGCETYTLYEVYQRLGESVEKVLVCKEDGFRICHPLIAERVLERIYQTEDFLYQATEDFIGHMDAIYHENGREYLDALFRELFIDRSYIDGEQQKFSLLISDMKRENEKKAIFERLTKLYPDNPHYLNHLGRLEVADDNQYKNYNQAISDLNGAIAIAQREELSVVSHYITLACIYSKKIITEINDKKRTDITIHGILELVRTDFMNASDCFEKARALQKDSSYVYFPYILMICNMIKVMTRVERQPVDKLLENEEFSIWYHEYAGVAVYLYTEMERNCDEGNIEGLKAAAQERLSYIQGKVEALKKRLEALDHKKIQDKNSGRLRRAISSLLYCQNSFRWDGIAGDDIEFIVEEMYKNLKAGDYLQSDIMIWFNAYRESPDFDPSRAITLISDYMEASYYKEYLLWWLFFLEYEKGLVGESVLEAHLSKFRHSSDLALNAIRTSSYVDAYTDVQAGCPVKNYHHLVKDDDGEASNLKVFTGTITKISGSTSGYLMMDKTNLEVFFTPSFSVGGIKREFTSKDETKRVEFNLMFTYSGFRARNPKIIN